MIKADGVFRAGCWILILLLPWETIYGQKQSYDANIRKISAIKLLKEQVEIMEVMEVSPEGLAVEMIADCPRHQTESGSRNYYRTTFFAQKKQEIDQRVGVIYTDLNHDEPAFERKWLEQQAEQLLDGTIRTAYEKSFRPAFEQARKIAVARQWKEPDYTPAPQEIERIYQSDPQKQKTLIREIRDKILARCIFEENEAKLVRSLTSTIETAVAQLKQQLTIVAQSDGGVFRTRQGIEDYIRKETNRFSKNLQARGNHAYERFSTVEELIKQRALTLRKIKLDDYIRSSAPEKLIHRREIAGEIEAKPHEHKQNTESIRLLLDHFEKPFQRRLEDSYKEIVRATDGTEQEFVKWLETFLNSANGREMLANRLKVKLRNSADRIRTQIAHRQARRYFPLLEKGTYPFPEDLLVQGAEGRRTTVSMEESEFATKWATHRSKLLDTTENYLKQKLGKQFGMGITVLNDQTAIVGRDEFRTHMQEIVAENPNRTIRDLLLEYKHLVEPEWQKQRNNYPKALGEAYPDLFGHTQRTMRDILTRFRQDRSESENNTTTANTRDQLGPGGGTGEGKGDGPGGGNPEGPPSSRSGAAGATKPCPIQQWVLIAIAAFTAGFLMGKLFRTS